MTTTYSPSRAGSKRSAGGTRRTGGSGAAPSGRSKVRSTNHHEANPWGQHSAGATRQSSGQRQRPSDTHSARVAEFGGDQPLLRSNQAWVRRIASAWPITTACRIGTATAAGRRGPERSDRRWLGRRPPQHQTHRPRLIGPSAPIRAYLGVLNSPGEGRIFVWTGAGVDVRRPAQTRGVVCATWRVPELGGLERVAGMPTWLLSRANPRAQALLAERFSAEGVRGYHFRVLAAASPAGARPGCACVLGRSTARCIRGLRRW